MNAKPKCTLIVSRTPGGALDFYIEGANGEWPVRKPERVDLDHLVEELALVKSDRRDALLWDMASCFGIDPFPCLIRPDGLQVVPSGRIDEAIIVGYLTNTVKRILGDGIEIAVVHAAPFDIVEIYPWMMPPSR